MCDVVKVVGYVSGVPDPHASAVTTVVVRDFANNPCVNCRVWVDVSDCCDIVLCNVDGQTATRTADFFTDVNGIARLRVVGASRDPGSPPLYGRGSAPVGCGQAGARVFVNTGSGGTIDCGAKTTVAYDLNGALNPGTNGLNSVDVSVEIAEVNLSTLQVTYLGRGDQSCAFLEPAVGGCSALNGLDIAVAISTAVRVLNSGSQGCPGSAYFQKSCGP